MFLSLFAAFTCVMESQDGLRDVPSLAGRFGFVFRLTLWQLKGVPIFKLLSWTGGCPS
ncbi:hypothetical protein SLEP1_g916 [Rubroshorea leprosula]|uniref:Uncharacterized protein n=1 Tax=Rubroshorea leprosula TaxID=152421 RepID=A0AAV5HIW4_9ROSI|nr:hypothetical protein SLEP1_g916 [Rubroshorea leprosula]